VSKGSGHNPAHAKLGIITRYPVTHLAPILSSVNQELQVGQPFEMDLDTAVANRGHDTARKLLKAVEEFQWEVYTHLWRRVSKPC
jgi:hypothetical protein